MNTTTYPTETVRLTPAEFAALEFVNAGSWLDDYSDPDNREQTIDDDELTEAEYEIEHEKAKLCRLEPESFEFVRDSSAFRQATFGLFGADLPPWDVTEAKRIAFRRTVNRLISKLQIKEPPL